MLNVSISALHCWQYNHLNTLLKTLLNEIIFSRKLEMAESTKVGISEN